MYVDEKLTALFKNKTEQEARNYETVRTTRTDIETKTVFANLFL